MPRINERGRYNPARLNRKNLEAWKRPMADRIVVVEAMPDDICRCGHPARYHRAGDPGPLGPCIVEKGFQNGVAGVRCDCERFRAAPADKLPQTAQHEGSDEVVEPELGNENELPEETEQVEVGSRSRTDGLA